MTTPVATTSPSRGRPVTSAEIQPYLKAVDAIASRLAGTSRARRVGAEYDDLFQEGLVAVWQSLLRGVDPMLVITNRMKDWIRFQGRLGHHDHADYGALLPIELGDDAPRVEG